MKIDRQVEQVYICVQGRNCIEYFSATNIVFKRLSDLLPSTVFTVKLFMLIMNMHNHEGGDVLTDWKSTEQCITMQLQQKQQSSSLTALSHCSVYYSSCWGRTHFNSAAINGRSLEHQLLPPRRTLIWICLSVFLIIVQEHRVLLRAQFPFQKFFFLVKCSSGFFFHTVSFAWFSTLVKSCKGSQVWCFLCETSLWKTRCGELPFPRLLPLRLLSRRALHASRTSKGSVGPSVGTSGSNLSHRHHSLLQRAPLHSAHATDTHSNLKRVPVLLLAILNHHD